MEIYVDGKTINQISGKRICHQNIAVINQTKSLSWKCIIYAKYEVYRLCCLGVKFLTKVIQLKLILLRRTEVCAHRIIKSELCIVTKKKRYNVTMS
jgi:hypothetical protein